jgi:hypothetical protein
MAGTQPLFDMSQAQPINSAAQGKPLFDMSKATPLPGSGEQLNDVGNRVIVPKDGESFSDRMARAVASGKTVTQPQIDAEMRTAPAKVAQTLVGAATIGAAMPAAEVAGGAGLGGILPRVLPGTIAGVKAIGAWAKAHPVLAYIVYDQPKQHSDVIPFIKGLPTDAPGQ